MAPLFAERIKMAERPDRYRNSIVPHIYVDGASDAIAFHQRAFGDLDPAEMERRGNALSAR
jgi:hypothetical protein